LGPLDLRLWLPHIHWVILGGESGPGSRPMHVEWARSVRDQCIEFGLPLFFKQWGNHAPDESGEQLVRMRSKNERLFDGRTWDQFPVPVCSLMGPRIGVFCRVMGPGHLQHEWPTGEGAREKFCRMMGPRI
ncbi:MAG: DUF5131 family protein, partial [Polyangiaceae bacterium]